MDSLISLGREAGDDGQIEDGFGSQYEYFQLSNQLFGGWYIVELALDLPNKVPQANLFICDEFSDNDCWTFNVQILTGRISKCIFKVRNNGALKFRIRIGESGVKVSHFALKRVHRGFAESRMLKKLVALHPDYRRRYDGLETAGPTAPLRKDNIAKIWQDYRSLFVLGRASAEYRKWIEAYGNCGIPVSGERVEPVLFSLVMPVFDSRIEFLSGAIESIKSQSYRNWELCIADDCSSVKELREFLDYHAALDSRIKVTYRTENGHISAASNSAIALASGDWIVLVDHDDLLHPEALQHVAKTIEAYPHSRLIYSDEDKIDEDGLRSDPYFKPDWNADLILSQNYFSHLGAYRADLIRHVGGFREGFEGAQDYDLVLRCVEQVRESQIIHIPRVLYHWRIHSESTALSNDSKPYAVQAGVKAINEHLARTQTSAVATAVPAGYRVRYSLPTPLPAVTVIIPTRDKLSLIQRCVDSILSKTDYANYRILIVDNGSTDLSALSYLDAVVQDERVKLLRIDVPFNYSSLNNQAVAECRSEFVCFLNNDTEVLDGNWLGEMVSHAVRPNVGAVGARLLYADRTIQHAGVVLGVEGCAGHVHRFLPEDDPGYCGRAALIQSFSAVTAACLVVRKSLFEQVGGFNQDELAIACNDIDLCLKLKKIGFRSVWTPYAELLHHESSSRGFDATEEQIARSNLEIAYMWRNWGDWLSNDPAYNPNLTLKDSSFGLAWPPRLGASAPLAVV